MFKWVVRMAFHDLKERRLSRRRKIDAFNEADFTLEDVLDDTFIRTNTVFSSQEAFFNRMPNIDLSCYKHVMEIDHYFLDYFIYKHTVHTHWNDFMTHAVQEKMYTLEKRSAGVI
ncbi:hypothetical protein LCM20_01295 [Halobacillus litoralis]|uniref:hypothetical protein n=1 Tax=Halobacillus litoralis TaxID=45668 RepID=UPI001CD6B683|nr:hypothetical protein [Halobacillus litoralis]MCA0969220.1 hypothetical protein [Halobacillus litoralis]